MKPTCNTIFCTKCAASLLSNAKFCSQCAAPVQSPKSYNPQQQKAPSYKQHAHREYTPALQTSEGKDAYNKIRMTKKEKQVKGALFLLLTLFLLAFLFSLPSSLHWAIYLVASVPSGVLSLYFFYKSKWTVADYYTIPGSKDTQGEHRCIHCGSRGIYRHTIYQTDTTLADCPKCKTNLWQE